MAVKSASQERLNVLNDMYSFLVTSIKAEEPNKMLYSFKVGRSRVDSSAPVLFGLLPPIERKTCRGEIGGRLNMAALE